MRIIDADKSKKQIAGMAIVNGYLVQKVNKMCELIDEQPTAYDVDAVVEQLEKYSNTDEAEQLGTIPVVELTDAIEAAKAGYDTKNNPRREAYLKALEDYHDSVQDSYMRLASGLGRHGLYISYIIEENNEIFKMLKVGASEIE